MYIVSRKFKRRKTEFDPITKKYLVQYAWGMSNSYLVKLKRSFDEGLFVQKSNLTISMKNDNSRTSIIDNVELCKRTFTPAYLYAKEYYNRFCQLDYSKCTKVNKSVWEAKARECCDEQPFIRSRIIDYIRKKS